MLGLRLKEYTKNDHAVLEKRFIGAVKRVETTEQYVRLLTLLYGYYGAVEAMLDQYLSTSSVSDYAVRRKAVLILNDIAAYSGSTSNIPMCTSLPQVGSYHAALGVLYVTEGSTLGGEIISGILATKLNTSSGLSFFRSYGERVREMWDAFKLHLECSYSTDEEILVLKAARETFLTFYTWMDGHD